MKIRGYDNDGKLVEFSSVSISSEWKVKRYTLVAGIGVIVFIGILLVCYLC